MTGLLLVALGCAADDKGSPAETGAETGVEACGLAEGLALESGEPAPGEALIVSLQGAALPDEATVSWSTEDGAVEPGAQASATWTLSTDLALHLAEQASLTALVEAPGCAPESWSLTLTVDRPEPSRVVVIYNTSVEGSEAVARAYAASREIPTEQLCAITADDDEYLSGDAWPALVETVQACIDAVGEHVHYLVPVYGVPYRVGDRIADIGTGEAAIVSVDALLVFGARSTAFSAADWNDLYQPGDSMAGEYDPYVPFGELRAEMRRPYYLVARIDGASVDAALALVERAALAQTLADSGALAGNVYVDAEYGSTPPASDAFGSYESGDWNMWGVATIFEDDGRYPVVFDTDTEEFGTSPAQLWCEDALYYAGWYTYYHYNDAFDWTDGAIGGHLDSCSACSLRDGLTWSSGALERGITATFGAVSEPYVAGMPEYDQLFLYLLQGASFGEAAYESTQVARWMMVWVGDPLYRPYPGG